MAHCIRKISLLIPAVLLFLFPAQPAWPGLFSHDLEVFEEILDIVADKYVYPPDYKKLFNGAVKGMAAKVDPDNVYFTFTEDGRLIGNDDQHILFHSTFHRSDNMDRFKRLYFLLLERFKDKIDKKTLEEAATSAMIGALDPYSQYLDKTAFDRSMKDTEGKYGGLGMVITMRDLKLVVVKTMKRSPAERAGILPNDVITHVNEKSVKGLQIHELAEKLRGLPNTQVKVTLFRPSANKERTWLLTREIIAVETVTHKMLNESLGYIHISSFAKLTDDQLEEALIRLRAEQARALILDLRDNPGGLLEQSVNVASHFLRDGDLVVYTQGRRHEERSEYRAETGLAFNMPLLVLINHYSASASEIVSGSLKDSGKALIVGDYSYGKGSVQTIFKIRGGAGLRLTTSKYYTPSGTDITAHGIIPDIQVTKDPLPMPGEKQEAARPKEYPDGKPRVRLKESEIEKFFKEREYTPAEGEDLLVGFAGLILKDSLAAEKSPSLEKVMEIAANIRY